MEVMTGIFGNVFPEILVPAKASRRLANLVPELGLTLNMTCGRRASLGVGRRGRSPALEGRQVGVSVLDPNGTPTENGFKDALMGASC